MKKLSVTSKITIWYAVFLIVFATIFLAVTLWNGKRQTVASIKAELVDEVDGVEGEIEKRNNHLGFTRKFDLYDDGVYISMYDQSGELIEGKMPVLIYKDLQFKDSSFQEMSDKNGVTWYIYDKLYEVSGESVWIRGIMKDTILTDSFRYTMNLGFLGLPILLVIAILGGYVFTKRSFRPIKKIISFVESIQADGNFSKRIDTKSQLSESNDEINRLSSMFNDMFDVIEESFLKEKQFTSDVSHELRTPLASVIAQSEYALEDETYQKSALEKINKEARRMSDLVGKLLILSRGDAGKIVAEMEEVNFSQLCETILEQQTIIFSQEDMIFEGDIEKNVFIFADETMVIRMLLNFVENATKYGKNTNGEKTRIIIKLKTEKGKAICSVTDNGTGISKENLGKIWDRLYRVDKSRSEGGSGLGLSIVKVMAEANKAKVWAESEVNKGSTFYIEFDLMNKEKSVSGEK